MQEQRRAVEQTGSQQRGIPAKPAVGPSAAVVLTALHWRYPSRRSQGAAGPFISAQVQLCLVSVLPRQGSLGRPVPP